MSIRHLYLAQHAEAKSEKEDPQRGLSERGKSDIKKVAEFISKQMNLKVNKIAHSQKLRASQTAEILAEYLRPSDGIEAVEWLAPLDDISIWAKRLIEIKKDIMLVGHLPHLDKLSAFLLCGDENKKIVDFQMGGVVCLVKDESDIFSVQWMLIPQMLS